MKSKFEQWLSIITGLFLLYFGVQIIRHPLIIRKFTGYVIDTRPFNIPIGIGCIAIGAALTIYSVKTKVKPEKYYICKNCESTFTEAKKGTASCSACGGRLVEMGKYFSNNKENT